MMHLFSLLSLLDICVYQEFFCTTMYRQGTRLALAERSKPTWHIVQTSTFLCYFKLDLQSPLTVGSVTHS